jgi:hypothetical protein
MRERSFFRILQMSVFIKLIILDFKFMMGFITALISELLTCIHNFNVERRIWKALRFVFIINGRIHYSMFDVRRSSFKCLQGVDSSLKYIESEFTLIW